MKTSNKIVIAFSIFILAGMVTLFIDAKNHTITTAFVISRTYSLPDFSVIVAEQGSHLHIEKSDSNKLKIDMGESKLNPKKQFCVSNDTLYIYKGLKMLLKSKNLNTIIGPRHYYLSIYNFESDSMNLKIRDGKLNSNRMYIQCAKRIEKDVNLGYIQSDSAFVEINRLDLKNITVKAEKSIVNLENKRYAYSSIPEDHTNIKNKFSYKVLKIEKDSTEVVNVTTW